MSVMVLVLVYTKLGNILRAVLGCMRHFLADVTGDALDASNYHLQKVIVSPIHHNALLESHSTFLGEYLVVFIEFFAINVIYQQHDSYA